MFILKSAKGETVHLVPGEYLVGRKNCHIVLEGDQSISKRHAMIVVSHPQSNWSDPQKIPQLQIADAGSKYGSIIRSGGKSIKMEKDVRHTLNSGDEIQFGLQWNKWILTFEPLVVVVSALSKTDKQHVKGLVGGLGGHVVSEWVAETSHLTMSSITLTVKAICALAYGKPIVSPKFWEAYKKTIASKTRLPNYEEFVPVLGETVLHKQHVSFLVNPERRTLFKGKTFYFFSEPQFKDHGCLVEAAGGISQLVTDANSSKKKFVQENSVAMQLLSLNSQSMSLSLSQAPEWFLEIASFIKSEGKRLIPASEIGLAILHCSVETFCNADYNFSHVFLNRAINDTQPKDYGRILASETQTQDYTTTCEVQSNRGKIIPDSGTESNLNPVSIAVSNSSLMDASETQDLQHSLLKSTQPTAQRYTETQDLSNDSQLQRNIRSTAGPSTLKRSRVIDSDDDEVHVLPPPKQRYSAMLPNPPMVDLDDPMDAYSSVSSSVSSKSSRSRFSNISKCKDSSKACELFSDFQDYTPPTNDKVTRKIESQEVKVDDLFPDFKEDKLDLKTPETTNKCKMKPSELQYFKPTQTSSSSVAAASFTKRSRSSEDESGPPEKRLARLNISKPTESNDNLLLDDNDNDSFNENKPDAFLSANIKKEDLGMSSVYFKPLVVSRSNTTASSSTSTDTSFNAGLQNFKKFKKVCKIPIIPRIIGGSDLVAYQSSTDINNVQDLSEESEEEEGVCQWFVNFRGEKPKGTRARTRQL